MGLALLVLIDAPRRALAQLAVVGPATWRRVRPRSPFDRSAATHRHFASTGMGMAKRAGRWFLGR
jgi:hypothetical protein